MSLVFIRHLPTTYNLGGPDKERIRGQTDAPVPIESRQLAIDVGERFRGIPLTEVYSSDREAASLLAQQISFVTGAPLTLTPALRSWNLGTLQGHSVKDTKHQIQAYMRTPETQVPGGESWNQFVARYLAFLRPHWQQPGLCALVTHGRNIMVGRAWLTAGAEGDRLDTQALGADYSGTFVPHGGSVMATREALDGIL
jgi:broad specificity phosphatase PhoE